VTSRTEKHKKLQIIRRDLGVCKRCNLHTTRKNIVFGAGNPRASLLLAGEAPGEQEDLSGHPFVGRSGVLLDKVLTEAGIKREDVYVTNIVKCRPPGNRNPFQYEVEKCTPFLFRQITTISPKVIISLGRVASNLLLNNKRPLNSLRGSVYSYMGASLIPTYHPSYILRGGNKDLDLLKADIALALSILMSYGETPEIVDSK